MDGVLGEIDGLDEADSVGFVVDRRLAVDRAADVGGLVLLADLAIGVSDDVVRIGVDTEEAAPLGDGMTLYDVLSGQPTADTCFEGFDDPRLIAILDALSEKERAVTIARSRPGVTSWPEAARVAGLPQPEVAGEQIRRKVKRLAKQLSDRPPPGGARDGEGSGR